MSARINILYAQKQEMSLFGQTMFSILLLL